MLRHYWKLVVSVLALLLAVVAWQGLIDATGRSYTEAGLKRALLTFGIARGLNGVISVAQGTEVAIEPAGVGVVLAPGQILDPINDLVERFSWVMLASATSLGIQRVLLNVTAWPGFTLLVGGLVLAAVVVLWWPRPVPVTLKRVLYRLAAVFLVVRFAIPVIAICNEGIYSFFLEPQYLESRQQLEWTAQVIGDLDKEAAPPTPPPGESSWLDSAKRTYESAANAMNVQRRIDAFKQAAADVSEHAINLIVVFTLQTILFPLLFLWLIIQVVKGLVKARFGL